MNILKVLTKNRIKGNIGEAAVCRYLKRRGYKILEKNYTRLENEIDIIAATRDTLAIVEVKTRTLSSLTESSPRPAASVTPSKMTAIISEARGYIATHKTDKQIRFDVAEVLLGDNRRISSINYMEGAFTLDTARKKLHKGDISK